MRGDDFGGCGRGLSGGARNNPLPQEPLVRLAHGRLRRPARRMGEGRVRGKNKNPPAAAPPRTVDKPVTGHCEEAKGRHGNPENPRDWAQFRIATAALQPCDDGGRPYPRPHPPNNGELFLVPAGGQRQTGPGRRRALNPAHPKQRALPSKSDSRSRFETRSSHHLVRSIPMTFNCDTPGFEHSMLLAILLRCFVRSSNLYFFFIPRFDQV